MALISCYECKNTISDAAISCPHCGAPSRKDQVFFSPLDTPLDLSENKEYKKVSLGLGLLIFLFPLLFVWLLLDKKYSPKDKKIGFIYLAISLLFTFWYFQPTSKTSQSSTSTEQPAPFVSQLTNKQDEVENITQVEDPEPPESYAVKEGRADIQVSALKYYTDYQNNHVSANKRYKGNIILIQGTVFGLGNRNNLSILGSHNTSGEDIILANLQSSEKQLASNLVKGDIVQLLCTGGKIARNIPALDNCKIDGIDQIQHQAITENDKYLPIPSYQQPEPHKYNVRPSVVVIPAPSPNETIEDNSNDQDISQAIDQISQLQNANQL